MTSRTIERGLLIVLASALLAFYLVCASTHDLWPSDEPRYAEVAREMLDSGDYLVPHVNGKVYKEKPPLLFWAMAGASLPFGDVTTLSARFPSALSAVLVVLLTYWLARTCYGVRAGLWSAVVLATTQRFWYQSGKGQIDMLLTLCMMVCLCAFWLWHTRGHVRWLLVFYLAMGLGLLAKGPPALVFPLLLVIAFYWRQPGRRKNTHWLVGTVASLALFACWLIPARMAQSSGAGEAIAHDAIRQVIGRVFLGVSKAQWPWYYLLNTPLDLLPWALFLPWTVRWVWRHRHADEPMRLLLSWVVPAFVFFSLCIGKRAIYILPLFPVFAILIGRSLVDLIDGDHATWRKRTALCWALLLTGLAIGPFAVLWTEYAHTWNRGFLLFSLCAGAFALDTFRHLRKTDMQALPSLVASHFTGMALMTALFIFPVINEYKSARMFCTPVRAAVERGEDIALYSIGFSREEYVFYSRHFHTWVLHEPTPMPGITFENKEQEQEEQNRLSHVLIKAFEDVPIDWTQPISDETIEQWNKIIERAATEKGLNSDHVAAFIQGQREAAQRFDEQFSATKPAYAYVQQRQWAWLLTVNPELRHYTILDARQVGRRDVLLLANL